MPGSQLKEKMFKCLGQGHKNKENRENTLSRYNISHATEHSTQIHYNFLKSEEISSHLVKGPKQPVPEPKEDV